VESTSTVLRIGTLDTEGDEYACLRDRPALRPLHHAERFEALAGSAVEPVEPPCNVNDPEFAAAMVAKLDEDLGGSQ
jgi:uncharacterized protein (UPF0261 family)